MLWSKSVTLFRVKNRKQQIKDIQDKNNRIQWTWMQLIALTDWIPEHVHTLVPMHFKQEEY